MPEPQIPHILHQSWKSKTDLPDNFRQWRQSFFDLNSGIENRFYDDADNRALVEECFPKLLHIYDSFPKEIFRVDFVRPIYLFRFGGIYADLDFQCLADLTRSGLRDRQIVLGRMGEDASFPHSIPNAFMASRPGEVFWIGYLAAIERCWAVLKANSAVNARPEWVTGPVVLHQLIALYRNDRARFRAMVKRFLSRHPPESAPARLREGRISIYAAPALYPLNWKNKEHRALLLRLKAKPSPPDTEEACRMFPGSLAVTYWSYSWKPGGRPTVSSPTKTDPTKPGGMKKP